MLAVTGRRGQMMLTIEGVLSLTQELLKEREWGCDFVVHYYV